MLRQNLLKKKIEKSMLDRESREKSREDTRFKRNGELPPWGDATLYSDKLLQLWNAKCGK